MRMDERRKALVAVQPADTTARTVGVGNGGNKQRRIWADAVGANDVEYAVALELLPRSRIVYGNHDLVSRMVTSHKVGEVACLLQLCRHGRTVRVLVVLLVPLLAVMA